MVSIGLVGRVASWIVREYLKNKKYKKLRRKHRNTCGLEVHVPDRLLSRRKTHGAIPVTGLRKSGERKSAKGKRRSPVSVKRRQGEGLERG